MNQLDRDSAVATVRAAIEHVAPDVDASTLPLDVDVRLEADLDSMDFMAVLSEIKDGTGIDVPESEIARVVTIGGCADYLVERTEDASARPA